VLRIPAAKVLDFDEQLKDRIEEMWHTMYTAPGIGLAAPQIGDPRRIFVMDCSPRYESARRFVCINPEFLDRHGSVDSTEGCLSFPGLSVVVPRSTHVTLRAQDPSEDWFEVQLTGLEAICAQHEYDHLEGRSFLDLLSPLDRLTALQNYVEEVSRSERDDAAHTLSILEPLVIEALEQVFTQN
jgi:peptide deformylase